MGNGKKRNITCDCGCGFKFKKCPYNKDISQSFSFTQGLQALILGNKEIVRNSFRSAFKALLSRPVNQIDTFIGTDQIDPVVNVLTTEGIAKVFKKILNSNNGVPTSKLIHESNKNRYPDQVERYLKLAYSSSVDLKALIDSFFQGVSLDLVLSTTKSIIYLNSTKINGFKKTCFFEIKDILNYLNINGVKATFSEIDIIVEKIGVDLNSPDFKKKSSPDRIFFFFDNGVRKVTAFPFAVHENLIETFELIIPNFKTHHDKIKGQVCEEYIKKELLNYFGQSNLINSFEYDIDSKKNCESDFIGLENSQAFIFEVKGVKLGLLSNGNKTSDYHKIIDGYAQAIRTNQYICNSNNLLNSVKINKSWHICVGLYSVYEEESDNLNILSFASSSKVQGVNLSVLSKLKNGDFCYISIFDLEVLLKLAKHLNEPKILSHFFKQRSKLISSLTECLSSETLNLFGAYIQDPEFNMLMINQSKPTLLTLSPEFYHPIDMWWLLNHPVFLSKRSFIKKDA